MNIPVCRSARAESAPGRALHTHPDVFDDVEEERERLTQEITQVDISSTYFQSASKSYPPTPPTTRPFINLKYNHNCMLLYSCSEFNVDDYESQERSTNYRLKKQRYFRSRKESGQERLQDLSVNFRKSHSNENYDYYRGPHTLYTTLHQILSLSPSLPFSLSPSLSL